MSNIALGSSGNGHYDETVFERNVYSTSADCDWWIEERAWQNLLNNLRGVNFEVKDSRWNVASFINCVARDLPANPGVRFPADRGTLGTVGYTPLRFRRVNSQLRALFESVVHIAIRTDQPLSPGALDWGNTFAQIATAQVPSYNRAKFEREHNLAWVCGQVIEAP